MHIIFVSMAKKELGELCCVCTRFVKPGQLFARSETSIAHYKCAKKRGWKRESRAKPKPEALQIRKVKIIKRKDRELT